VHDPDTPPPLPRREPRSLGTHFLVDTAVAFLMSVFVLLVWDVDIISVVVFAAVVGLSAAPFTRRAEIRALAARPEPDGPPPDGAHGPTT
jgi:hypothetical protein